MIERILLLAAVASLASAQFETGTSAASSITSATDSSNTASATDSSSSTTGDAVTHTVDVGLAGHTFQPDVTLANVGDTIEFNFFPTNHSVIRAEYLMPCVPYELTGRSKIGFNSNFLPVDAILENPPTWRVVVNNTDPIFYYCGAEGSCINWQMVGVINPNSSTSLQAHKQAAEDSSFMLLPGEKWPDESTDPMASDSAASSSSSSSSSSSTASSTADAAGSSNSSEAESSSGGSSGLSTGAIAGIAVGGTVAVIGAAALIFFCGRASRRRNAAQAQQQPLMHQQNGAPPFSPGPNNGHMSYVQPYPADMNKHMSIQSMSMNSPALPGYVPHQQGPGQAGPPLYGPSDALNPGAAEAYGHHSPQQSPNMMPMYGQQRNSVQPYGNMQPQSPQTPFAAPHPSASPPPQNPNQYHEMPGAPVSYLAHAQQSPQMHGGSELSASDAPTLNNQGGYAGQGGNGNAPPGGIMNFIKQNTGS